MRAKESKQGLVMGMEVQHDAGVLPDLKHMNAGKRLEYPAGGGALCRMPLLVGEGLLVRDQSLADAVFQGSVDHQAQGHNRHEGHDPCGGLEE